MQRNWRWRKRHGFKISEPSDNTHHQTALTPQKVIVILMMTMTPAATNTTKPAKRVPEPSEKALELSGRASEPSERALEPAGRPGERDEEKMNGVFTCT